MILVVVVVVVQEVDQDRPRHGDVQRSLLCRVVRQSTSIKEKPHLPSAGWRLLKLHRQGRHALAVVAR